MRRNLVWSAVALALTLPIVALAAELDPKAQYEASCQKCHGPDGKGDTTAGRAAKVVKLQDPKFAVGEAEFRKLIDENKKHKKPLKNLTDEQINTAAKYARTLVGQ